MEKSIFNSMNGKSIFNERSEHLRRHAHTAVSQVMREACQDQIWILASPSLPLMCRQRISALAKHYLRQQVDRAWAALNCLHSCMLNQTRCLYVQDNYNPQHCLTTTLTTTTTSTSTTTTTCNYPGCLPALEVRLLALRAPRTRPMHVDDLNRRVTCSVRRLFGQQLVDQTGLLCACSLG